jgi:catechol 2,3-dioxygenase-like lactoylglutathione lyase family enzyme
MSQFYRDVLQLPLLFVDRGRPHFDLGGIYLVILQGQPQDAKDTMPPRFPILAFAVDNLDEAVHQLEASGVELPWGIERDSHSSWVMFRDPGGNLLEIAMFGGTEHKS